MFHQAGCGAPSDAPQTAASGLYTVNGHRCALSVFGGVLLLFLKHHICIQADNELPPEVRLGLLSEQNNPLDLCCEETLQQVISIAG